MHSSTGEWGAQYVGVHGDWGVLGYTGTGAQCTHREWGAQSVGVQYIGVHGEHNVLGYSGHWGTRGVVSVGAW